MKTSFIKRIFHFIVGFLAANGTSYAFDYLLYPVITYHFGFFLSLLILFSLAVVFNYLLILGYDFFKKDLFGFEDIKKFKEKDTTENLTRTQRILRRLISYGDIPAFIALSIYNPFIATLYKRKNSTFSGFVKRDYAVLVMATFIGCAVWSIVWSPILLLKK